MINVNNIDSFYMNYSSGYSMYSYTTYSLNKENGKYTVKIKPNGVSDYYEYSTEVDSDFVEKLEKIIKEYDVNSWDGFNKTDRNVLDGDSFSLSIITEDNKSITAHGYMSWPKNYTSVKKEVDNLFMNIYNKRSY